MKCVICKNGTTKKGKVTVTLEKKNAIVVIKDVPANVCNNCGHYYLDVNTAKEVSNKANESIKKGSLIDVIKMKKPA